MKVMLEEIERRRDEAERGRQEARLREQERAEGKKPGADQRRRLARRRTAD